jgi:hypothetical protein
MLRRITAVSKIAIPDAPGPSAKRSRGGLGHFPAIALLAAVGLLLCAIANTLARATDGNPILLYWLGILVIAAPIFYRLTSREASVAERLALVCLLGLSLYGVKVMRDAPLFTFSDELIHAFNANQIDNHRHLFETNSILRVTPYYPGLEGATSALMTMTGLSSYTCGAFIVGAARLVLMSALFLLFLRVGGSARVAGLAAAIYTCNFNFLFWGAQYSYESLALPLLLVIMMAVAEREVVRREALRAWAVPIVIAIAAVLVTHHLTSYAVVAILLALSLAYWYLKRSWGPPNPWRFALFAAILAVAWLLVVAGSTIGYLSPVLSGAIKAIVHTFSGEEPPRQLFQKGSSAVGATPQAARAVALLAIAILFAGLPFGLRELWRRHRKQPFAIVFAIAAVGFFGTLALRIAPSAWETGNRLSEFLFVGLAFVLAYAGFELLRHWPSRPRLARGVLAGIISLVLIGNAISGWPWDSQLPRPLRISANGKTIVSPPLAMAEWAAHDIANGRFAAPTADANLLLVPGDKSVLTGPYPNVEGVLKDPDLGSWQLPLLRRHKLRYVVSDLRPAAADGIRGYYFTTDRSSEGRLPRSVTSKFNRVPGVARIYANGPITVFDLEGER